LAGGLKCTPATGYRSGMDEQPNQSAGDSEPAGPAKKRRGPGRPFQKNDPRIRQNWERAMQQELTSESEGMLAAMVHVVTKPAWEDRTHEQRNYRDWLKRDIKGFMAKKADLEKAEVAARQSDSSDGPVEPKAVDEGTRRVMELLAPEWEKVERAELARLKAKYEGGGEPAGQTPTA
jgi:hypothetical protein